MPKPSPRDVPDRTYVVVALLVAIAGLAVAAFALTLSEFFWVIAIVSAVGLAWRRWYLRSLRDPLIISAAFLVVLAVVLANVISTGGGKHVVTSAPSPKREAANGKVIHVYNKVTSGAKAMRDDDKDPVFLASKRVAFCDERGCSIPGTHRETGQTYRSAVCRQKGERVTNGQDDSRDDNGNPELFSSRWYYGVRLSQNTFGYINETWVAPADRGGQGLPACF